MSSTNSTIALLKAQVTELTSILTRVCEHLDLAAPRTVADGVSYVTPKMAMSIAGCSRSAIQKMIRRKKDPVRCITVGNRTLIEVDSLVAELRRKPSK